MSLTLSFMTPYWPGVLAVSWDISLWLILAALSLVFMALCSGSELGIFSLSRVRLRLRVHHHDPRAILLSQWLEHPTYALEGLLVLQNIAGFIFSASVTALLSGYGFSESMQALISTLIIMPLILVFAEVMPKDLFHLYADRWVYGLVPLFHWSFRLITVIPILPLVRLSSRISTWFVKPDSRTAEMVGPRTEILHLFQESVASGEISGTQQDLVQRALRMARINIREVMIPWNRVIGVPAAISREGFRALVRHYNVSRMPILGKSTNEVLGIVEVLEVLGDRQQFSITKHLQTPMTLIGEQSVRSAITLMQRARQTLAIVVDRQGRAIGLVTMKDLVEELIGDLENW